MIDVDKPTAPAGKPDAHVTDAGAKQGARLVADECSDGHKAPDAKKPGGA